jgi:hypothetical protein
MRDYLRVHLRRDGLAIYGKEPWDSRRRRGEKVEEEEDGRKTT